MSRTPIRVLCVDDNGLIADAMERRFSLEREMAWDGWVGDPQQALSTIVAKRPDVVMLDIDMPGYNSFDLVKQLSESAPETRVLMFSGHVRTDYIDRAIDAGAWGYVSKNDTTEEILSAIRRVAAGEFVATTDVQAEYRRER